ncbi:hypothetical protein [Humibacter sp. RRB41]|uniref:hypothetical protein n=1 Tax=Humibacter sp. RRB41 TaxID=2919946 RepID=UPI001FAADC6F|nr:hypothetical protein [Humibacter sp. RRB41]
MTDTTTIASTISDVPAAVEIAPTSAPDTAVSIPAVVTGDVAVQPAKPVNTTFAKYSALLFTALITIGSAAQILPAHHTQGDLVQFGILAAGAIGAVFAGIVSKGPWPGILKTGIAIIAAVLTILQPYLANGASITSISPTNWIVFGVAALNAVAVEFGIQIRTTADAKVAENLLK